MITVFTFFACPNFSILSLSLSLFLFIVIQYLRHLRKSIYLSCCLKFFVSDKNVTHKSNNRFDLIDIKAKLASRIKYIRYVPM